MLSLAPKDFLRVCARTTSIRHFHATPSMQKTQAARYVATIKRDLPLTYEQANFPEQIAHRKSWNSWNTSNLQGGLNAHLVLLQDTFIRRFMKGTWHDLFVSEIIIKRQHNIIRVAGIIRRGLLQRKMYFLIGYSEELLSYWLQSPVKLELQTVADKKDVIFKYI